MPSLRLFTAVVVLTVFNLATAAATVSTANAQRRVPFDRDWHFQLGDATGAEQPSFSDSAWRTLDLPHDWSIEGAYDEHAPTGGPGGYLPTGIGWYRKSFRTPENAKDKLVSIEFDGVYEHSTVWVNGHELGQRPYGYSTFTYNLTPYLKDNNDPNVIAVRVDNSEQPNSRWYSGSGIDRNTWLTVTDKLHIAWHGLQITTPEISTERATVLVKIQLQNQRAGSQPFEVRTRILDATGQPVAQQEGTTTLSSPHSTESGEFTASSETSIETSLAVRHPSLWSPASPTLYRLRTELYAGNALVDSVDTLFGIRSIEYDVNRGLLLNGTPVKLRGMCLHQDAGAVGSAVPPAMLERRLRLLQEMGCNAIRCSHNPMDPSFYDLCDRLGLLVMDEAFDEWTFRKPQIKFGYSDVFNDWSERDLVDFIRRDRNHPCIVMWSAGNEIGEQRAEKGPTVLKRLVDIFHREDPTRPVTAAMDNIFNEHGQAPVAFSDLLDIVGYNYVDRWGTRRETQYGDDRYLFPKRKFVGTEISTMRGDRGEYHFGPVFGGGFIEEKQTSTYGPEAALYLTDSIHAASLWRFTATHDYVIGDFGWTGFDYLGESRWPRKLSTSGALDTCGFKKDTFYFYQSQWTTKPMIHLLPHWNWPDRVGKIVPVVAYSNCAAIELFLNGRSLGAKAREFPAQGAAGGWNKYPEPEIHTTTADLQFTWDVVYEPGELKAVGYDRYGKIVSEAKVATAGPATALQLVADRPNLTSDHSDVAHVTVQAFDEHGNPVPLANNAINFELTGPGKLIGLDNGNPESHESYKGTTRNLYNGMALALVQSTDNAGKIRLVAHADGLRDAAIEIATQPAQ